MRIAKSVMWLLGGLLAAYLVVVAVLFVSQRRLLYFPPKVLPTPEAAGIPMQAVRLTTEDGLDLAAWYAPPRQADGRVVVIFHGNAGSIAQRGGKAMAFLAAGYGVMMPEYRGFAGNPGSPSEQGLYRDARAALRWLADHGIPAERLILHGESLGTGVAVHIASETTPAAVILESPYTSIPDVAALQYRFIPVQTLMLDRYDSLAKIGRVRAPLLIIHGEQDTLIPAAQGARLHAAANEPKRLVLLPGGDHVNLAAQGAGPAMQHFLSSLPAASVSP